MKNTDEEVKLGDLVLYRRGCHFLKRDSSKVFGVYSDDETEHRSGYRFRFTLRIFDDGDKTVIKCRTRPGVFGIISSVVLPFGVLAAVRYFSEALIPVIIIGSCAVLLNSIPVIELKKELDGIIGKLFD